MTSGRPAPSRPRLLSGLDVALRETSLLLGRRIGLLANPASVTSGFVPAARALREVGVDVRVLFGPEHGLFGEQQDMEAVAGVRRGSSPRVVSLYGSTFAELSPRPEDLAGLDAVVCDLPDVGSRYYTFVWTTALVQAAAARAGIEVVVLDRPNPLGGLGVEGNLPEDRLLSFVGLHPVPVRHGMTAGEIARLVDASVHGDLTVVPMELEGKPGRTPPRERIGETPAWVLPSPNMPSRSTALVYPGACLAEGTNLSEGRGTTRPFELIGAPWIDPDRAADAAASLELPGVVFRPHVFRPTFQKHAGERCGGVQLHVTDEAAFRPYETGLRLVKALRDLAPARFAWRTEAYEFRDDVPAIDLLTGTATYRALVDAGEPLSGWISTFPGDVARFGPARERALLYRRSEPPVVQVVGAHEAGKTTLAVRLVSALVAEGLRVAAVKQTSHFHPTDMAGKDSERLAEAGADPVFLVAAGRTARHSRPGAAPALAALLDDPAAAGSDLVVVEGYRSERFPKIEVYRPGTGRGAVAAADPTVFAVVGPEGSPHPPSVPRYASTELTALLRAVRAAVGLLEER